MNLSSLVSVKTKGKRRLGQGHGSGRVKTSGRGTKGQKARNKVPQRFEGGALPLTKRMPYLRGKGRNKKFAPKSLVINLKDLSVFSKGQVVDVEALIKVKLVKADDAKKLGVKILGDGKIENPLTIKVPISNSAAKKIEKAGGKIE